MGEKSNEKKASFFVFSLSLSLPHVRTLGHAGKDDHQQQQQQQAESGSHDLFFLFVVSRGVGYEDRVVAREARQGGFLLWAVVGEFKKTGSTHQLQ